MSTLRVIAGSAKGRRLLTLPGVATRPILDRVKAALFDIERPALPGTRWLDLFAGTGAVGIEALSQGAAHCTFTELSDKAVRVLRQNIESTGLHERSVVRHTDAFLYLRQVSDYFDRIYVAPPQYEGHWVEALRHIAERPELLGSAGKVIVQIDPKEFETLSFATLTPLAERKYGNTLLLWFGRAPIQALGQPTLKPPF